MKKKLLIILSLVFCFTLATFTSCSKKTKTTTYTYTFVTNCEITIKPAKISKGKDYTLPTPDRGDNWKFLGWYLDEDFSGNPVLSLKAENSATFYAQWERLYNLTLDVNGGTLDGETSYYLPSGTDVSSIINNTPTKAGCEFGEWMNGNTVVSGAYTMPEEDVTLVAKYKVGYTVDVYKQNTALDGYDKETLTLYDYATNNFELTYVPEGYTLAENENSVTSGALKEEPGAGENAFVAYYDRIKYSLKLNSNYPDSEAEVKEETYNLYYGIPFTLPHKLYSYSGYFFTGWTAKDSEGVDYPMDYIDTLLYNSSSEYSGVEYLAQGNLTLYACWSKGYTNIFGGADLIYLLGENSESIYLNRGGKFFKGNYYSDSKEFDFINKQDNTIIEGKILDDNTFCYNDAQRQGFVVKYFSVSEGLKDNITVRFGAFDELVYSEVDKDGNADVSEGNFTIKDNGAAFEIKFKNGSLSGQTKTITLKQVQNSKGNVENVFIIRNEEEYALGTLMRFTIVDERDADGQVVDGSYMVTAYNNPYYTLTLSGYGTAVYYNGNSPTNCYYTYDAEQDAYKLSDSDMNVIGYAKVIELYSRKGYVFYASSFNNTFVAPNGDTLKLDGMMNAVYETESEYINGYYTLSQSYLGGYIVTVKKNGTVYKFAVNAFKEGEGEQATIKYVMETKSPDYAEYYYYMGDQKIYFPVLVLNDGVKGEADLYARTATRSIEKVSHGTYTYNETTGLYVYNATEVYEVDQTGSKIDVSNINSIVFAIDDTSTSYKLYYWYSYSADGQVEDVVNTVEYTPSKQSQEGYKLTIVSGFAILSLSETETYTGLLQTSKDGLHSFGTLTADGTPRYFYFETDEENKTFLLYDSAPFTAYVYREDGTAVATEHMKFDGKGGVVYTVDGVETVGEVAQTGEQFGEDVVMQFTSTGAETVVTFRFILIQSSSNIFFSVLSDKQGVYTGAEGMTLSLDGTGFNAVYTDAQGNELYSGMYRARGNDVVYIYFNEEYVYFNIDLTAKTFTLLGNEIGDYLYIANGSMGDTVFQLDGKGNLVAFKFNDDRETYPDGRQIIDDKGTYTFDENKELITFNYSDQGAAQELTGRLSTISIGSSVYRCFFTNFSEVLGVYVNEEDNSVLYLDDIGNALRFLKDGDMELGTYTLITDGDYKIFYYVNNDGSSATLYEINGDSGYVSYVNSPKMAYYNENLSSLQFSQYGFAIFNGETRYYFYIEDDDNIAIYHRAQEGETANKYGFVKEILGAFDADTLTYKGTTYYINDGYSLTFARQAETAANYPIAYDAENAENKAPLENLVFTPTGAAEFSVVGAVTINGERYQCNVVRRIVKGENGAADTYEVYVLIGYYRFDINITYSSDPANCKYEIVRMRYLLDAESYMYAYYYMLNYSYYGPSAAANVPKVGHISVWKEYDINGDDGGKFYMSGTFYQASGVYDVDGTPITFEKAECVQEGEYFNVRFEYKDGYTYQGIFSIDTSLGMLTYKMSIFVREQTFTKDNIEIVVSRIVSSENLQMRVPGDLATLSIRIDGVEVSPEAILKMGEKYAYIVRTKDEAGKVTGSTYYYVELTDEAGDVSSNLVKPYLDAILTTEAVSVYFTEDTADCKVYVDIGANNDVKFIHFANGYYTVAQSEYDEATGIYTVTLKSGKVYTVQIVNGLAVITEQTEQTEQPA